MYNVGMCTLVLPDYTQPYQCCLQCVRTVEVTPLPKDFKQKLLRRRNQPVRESFSIRVFVYIAQIEGSLHTTPELLSLDSKISVF